MAKTVLGAVVELIDANDAALGIDDSGGTWVGEVPENKPLPLVGIIHGGEVPEWTFERPYIETTTLELHAFAVGLAAAEGLALALKSLLDWTPNLAVTAAHVIRCRRVSYAVRLADFRDKAGALVFEAISTYEIDIRRTLPAGARVS